ncbi:MAG: inorganic phosphate transporter [Bacteroidetes bacterium]|nr:MAG: inorganic phosphate transporter [Bacteroidota bacterium]
MENLYLFFVLALGFLAIADLIVGVSNDAVNFLSSAIGSKAVSFKKIMIIASFGIALGAIFSSGMMEVARKGIFNPELYYFDEIMIIFLAVMITDILLLDFFNTLGLPTSTTVSIVFELLGAAVSIAAYKIWENSQSINELITYINYSKATQIILGIILSVFIAFTIGAIVQWVSRLILSFDFKRNSNIVSSIFGGIAITSITYFILIKGIKGTSYSEITFDYFQGETINNLIESNASQIIIYLILIWSLISFFLIEVYRTNIYKIIILVGTFALALAFAGNDLVNFIGVPIAAWQSYEAWTISGIPADQLSMGILSSKVETPNLILFFAGAIMVITLWFSSRAKNVLKTSIDLSDQSEIKEKFKASILAKYLVTFFVGLNSGIQKIVPAKIKEIIENRFAPSNQLLLSNTIIEKPAFDMVRASVNLIVASILISIATSYKLPLSTTYVTFMVAMGTSLSDRAWGSESAIFRVSGVLNVIGGWFITAIVAFSAAALVALLMETSLFFMPILFLFTCFLLYRNYLRYNKEAKKVKLENEILEIEKNTLDGVINESSKNIENVLNRSIKIFTLTTEGISKSDIKLLKKNSRQVTKLSDEVDELQDNIFNYLKSNKKANKKATEFYLIILEKLTQITKRLSKISKITLKHVDENRRKLPLSNIKVLLGLDLNFKRLLESVINIFINKDFKKIEDILLSIIQERDEIENQIKRYKEINQDNMRHDKLHLQVLSLCSEFLTALKELLENYYSIKSEAELK